MVLRHLFMPKDEGSPTKRGGFELHRHFSVGGKLGSGKYSTVYRVRRLADGCEYSLKQTDITSLKPKARQDIVNECRLLASLEHPNLLRFHEAFVDHHTLCIVTELAPGGDLGQFIDKRAEADDLLSERQVWSIFLQCALAVRYLHHNRVLHRDLKPQNILLGEDGVVKVADLGVSQVLDTVFARALIGTPYYMSPEMWRREPYSFSADVWALGCILHELCSLQPLFAARTNDAVRSKVLSGALGPLPSKYSTDLALLLRLMLNPDPAGRPTMEELFDMPQVQTHLKHLPQQLRPYLNLEGQGLDQCVRLMRPVNVPCSVSDWDALNVFLPPARYPTGAGVVDALRKRRTRSCLNLTQLSGEEEDKGAGREQRVQGAAALAGLAGAGGLCGPQPGVQLPFGTGLPAQAAADTSPRQQARLLRRRATTAGQEAPRLQRTSSAAVMHTLARCSTMEAANPRAWQPPEAQLMTAAPRPADVSAAGGSGGAISSSSGDGGGCGSSGWREGSNHGRCDRQRATKAAGTEDTAAELVEHSGEAWKGSGSAGSGGGSPRSPAAWVGRQEHGLLLGIRKVFGSLCS